jgi:hypothetical protein
MTGNEEGSGVTLRVGLSWPPMRLAKLLSDLRART